MSLQNVVKDALEQYEQSMPTSQLEKLDELNALFEEMVAKGLVSSPTYNLEPISTLSFNLNNQIK